MSSTLKIKEFDQLNPLKRDIQVSPELCLKTFTYEWNFCEDLLEKIEHAKIKNGITFKWKSSRESVFIFGNILAELTPEHRDLLVSKEHPDLPLVSLLPFSKPVQTKHWKVFKQDRFIIPKLFIRFNNNSPLTFKVMETGNPIKTLEVAPKMEFSEFFNEENQKPNYAMWTRNLSKLLSRLDSKSENLSKVVMANEKKLLAKNSYDSLSLYQCLSKKNDTATLIHYYLERENTAFMGFTPETLLKKEGQKISIDAIAGTRPRSKDPQEDQALANQLRESDKEQREHREVIDAIKIKTNNIGHFSTGEQKVLKLNGVQHLKTPITLQLDSKQKNLKIQEIAELIHPTPAIGGTPTNEAVAFIKEAEPFERGYYAGALGYSYKDFSQFIVTIRSLISVNGEYLNLFAGAGIVTGSKPEDEWAELETKYASFFPSSLLVRDNKTKGEE